jgi:hypothetical protein
MKAIDINTTLIDGYLRLLENLSPGNKLDLISKLTLSVKTDFTDRKNIFTKHSASGSQNNLLMKSSTIFITVGLLTGKPPLGKFLACATQVT